MKTLFTDASFDYHSTNKTKDNIVRGKIAISDGKDFKLIEKVAMGKVENLQQYINVFELIAIARAIEVACNMEGEKSLSIHTDSQVALTWAIKGDIKAGIKTLAHVSALNYLRRTKIQYGGIVTISFVPRESNPAGHLLEKELEREAPHAQ